MCNNSEVKCEKGFLVYRDLIARIDISVTSDYSYMMAQVINFSNEHNHIECRGHNLEDLKQDYIKVVDKYFKLSEGMFVSHSPNKNILAAEE